jgi:hypothetical protein
MVSTKNTDLSGDENHVQDEKTISQKDLREL